jgi:SAM-dependent methyltransferase
MLPHRFDLVVSITALDHCVDDMEFEERMGQIANSLRPGGKFVFLEYSVDHFREKTSYQAFRSVKAWRDMLSNFELRLLGEDPFFHPQFAPISAWVVYSRSFFVRMIGLVERLRIQKAGAIRTRYLRKLLLKFPYEAPRESPIKLMWGQR